MARQIVWTEVAWNDLEAIADHIAKDSEHYAASVVLEAREAARSLVTMAHRGRVVPEFKEPKIRELLLGNYRLIYSLTDTTVYILAFIHGARLLRH